MRTLIGIDIGWSEKRASCGVAVRGPLPLKDKVVEYANDVRAVALTHRKLLALVESWSLTDAAIVVDGPLAPEGVPRRNRMIDTACATGDFHRRCQPYPIEGSVSEPFLKATDDVLAALGRPVHWFGGPAPDAVFAAEANPTVALALVMPRIAINRLSSRNRPLKWQDRSITAKSDWYWRHGAHRFFASAIDSDFSKENDHERCAALVCLSLAAMIVKEDALALGDETGIYAVPAGIDRTWQDKLSGLIRHGKAVFRDHMHACSSYWKESPELGLFDRVEAPEPPPLPSDGDLTLVLADSGGVWVQHNPWLAALAPPVFLQALDLPDCPTIILRPCANSSHWTIEPSASAIARMQGFDGTLSLRQSLQLRVAQLDRPRL